jgi:hypothetical protein
MIKDPDTDMRVSRVNPKRVEEGGGVPTCHRRDLAIAALNLTQQTKKLAVGEEGEQIANTALIDDVWRFAMDVRDLDISLIDRINPFGEAYAILAKIMSRPRLPPSARA